MKALKYNCNLRQILTRDHLLMGSHWLWCQRVLDHTHTMWKYYTHTLCVCVCVRRWVMCPLTVWPAPSVLYSELAGLQDRRRTEPVRLPDCIWNICRAVLSTNTQTERQSHLPEVLKPQWGFKLHYEAFLTHLAVIANTHRKINLWCDLYRMNIHQCNFFHLSKSGFPGGGALATWS